VLFNEVEPSIQLQLSIYSAGRFVCCMVCHGELYRLKPDPRHLTGYYLMIAAGGAVGGLFVAVIAPLIFTDYFELHCGLLLCSLLLLLVCAREANPGGSNLWRRLVCLWLAAGLVALSIALWRQAHDSTGLIVHRSRTFYGVLKVLKYDGDKPDQHAFGHAGPSGSPAAAATAGTGRRQRRPDERAAGAGGRRRAA